MERAARPGKQELGLAYQQAEAQLQRLLDAWVELA